MDIISGFGELGLSLPARVAHAQATLELVEKIKVPPPAAMPDAKRLGAQVLALARTGSAPDPTDMVRKARQLADGQLAAEALQFAREDAELSVAQELRQAEQPLLLALRPTFTGLYEEVAKLPDGVPSSALQAVHSNEKAAAAFRALEALAARHDHLRALHREILNVALIEVEDERSLTLWSDTRLSPAVGPSRASRGVAAGPADALARLIWLARPEAEAWAPSVKELNARLQEYWASLPINKGAAELHAAALRGEVL